MRRPRGSIVAWALVALLSITLAALAGRIWYVHEQTWQWAVQPTEYTPLLKYNDRSYTMGDGMTPPPKDAVSVGWTMGGGEMLVAKADVGKEFVTSVWVRGDAGTLSYGVTGGP